MHADRQGRERQTLTAGFMTSVNVYPPLSLWIQLASFFFTLSGIHGDLLVIRFFLFLAYLMLLINDVLGSPLWPDVKSGRGISVDSLAWSIVGLYVHGASLVHFILDERPVKLSEEQEALWRMFYRTGGLSKRLFQTVVLPETEIVEFQPGDDVPTEDFFYILYRGNVRLRVYGEEHELKCERMLRSAEMFDIADLGLLDIDSIILKNQIQCASQTRSQLFRFSRRALKKIARNRYAKEIWQSLLISNLSFIVEHDPNDSTIVPSDDRGRVFEPLETWERPKQTLSGSGSALNRPLSHLTGCISSSFSPPWPFGGHPTGIRQVLLPAPSRQVSNPGFHF
jgi:hypothetical protein